MGLYVVSPATHAMAGGRFGASFAMQLATPASSPRQQFRCEATFASRDAARVFAVTQGWLRTLRPQPMSRSRALPPGGADAVQRRP